MLNASSTPISERWLSPVPYSPKNSHITGTRAVINIRSSVTSVDTDLLPELLSWSAMMKAQAEVPILPSSPQSIPSDISKSAYSETVLEGSEQLSQTSYTLSDIFDPTTIHIGFDLKCLDGLDETLVYSPIDSFSEVCWTDAISDYDSDDIPLPLPQYENYEDRRQYSPSFLDTSSSDGSDTDSEDCQTYTGKASYPLDIEPIFRNYGVSAALDVSVGEFSSYDDYYHANSSFMTFEPKFPVSTPKESVACFPVPSAPHRKGVPSRIAALAHRLPFVRPTLS